MSIEEIAIELLKGVMAGHLGVVIIKNPEMHLDVLRGAIQAAQVLKRELDEASKR